MTCVTTPSPRPHTTNVMSMNRKSLSNRGVLYTKDLILADPEDAMRLGDFIDIFDRQALSFTEELSLPESLNLFKGGQAHIGLVRVMNMEDTKNPRCDVVGVITLEDVVEDGPSHTVSP